MLEYYSFIFFPFGFLTGPFTEFNHYMQFLRREVFKDVMGWQPLHLLTLHFPEQLRDSLFLASIHSKDLHVRGMLFCSQVARKILSRLVCHNRRIQRTVFIHPKVVVRKHSSLIFFARIGFLLICGELGTFKYYFAFNMGELSCNICGLSYNGKDKDGNTQW